MKEKRIKTATRRTTKTPAKDPSFLLSKPKQRESHNFKTPHKNVKDKKLLKSLHSKQPIKPLKNPLKLKKTSFFHPQIAEIQEQTFYERETIKKQ